MVLTWHWLACVCHQDQQPSHPPGETPPQGRVLPTNPPDPPRLNIRNNDLDKLNLYLICYEIQTCHCVSPV